MKKYISLNFLIALFSALAIFNSCSDSDSVDTEKPVINLIEPEEGDTLRIGSDVHLEMELLDNFMLGSYKIDIHSNFNDHGHATKSITETVDFTFNRSWSVEYQKNARIHHHEIVIPENATPGRYHFMVFCTDAAGNESYVVRNIVLSNEGGEEHSHE